MLKTNVENRSHHGAPRQWLDTLGCGATVMVIDTGLRPGEPYLSVKDYRLFVGDRQDDPTGHGTLVSLTVGSNNPYSIGMAPRTKLLVARAIDRNVNTWDSVVAALDWAIETRPDVINMSFAMAKRSPVMTQKLDTLDKMGVICCAAHTTNLMWPHSEESVIPVAALDGPPLIKARTVREWFTSPSTGKAGPFRGTSAACAVMAGIAACAKAYDSRITRQTFLAQLERS